MRDGGRTTKHTKYTEERILLAETRRDKFLAGVCQRPLTLRQRNNGSVIHARCCLGKNGHETPFTGGGWGVGEMATCRATTIFPPTLALPRRGGGDCFRPAPSHPRWQEFSPSVLFVYFVWFVVHFLCRPSADCMGLA